MKWSEFEKEIRDIASHRWNCNAVAETISGVRCDCILKVDPSEWIIVEITTENNLDKVRRDILKLRTVKSACMLKEILARCYFVMRGTPTDSMRQTGDDNKVKVMSAEEFRNEFFRYGDYIHTRSTKQFGSLINAETGDPEENSFVNVSYTDVKSGNELFIKDIIALLIRGKRVVLKGDFGLGKSRCVRQVFDTITSCQTGATYTIAINLRDHWGQKRASEIINRHFADLGIDDKNFFKVYNQSNVIYLLDGFDEIGTQSWSSDKDVMHHMREVSVCALKDLIGKVKGGVLITGREYYFNSDDELSSCLGLKADNTVFLECHDEFSESELEEYIKKNIDAEQSAVAGNALTELPVWFPKRPLVIRLMTKYPGLFSEDNALEDIYGFWCALLNEICEREARIYPALNPGVIKSVLIILADKTRLSANNSGPISQKDLSDAFVAAAGFAPNDESSIMLQRLPSLGRINADSPDRQFLDSFILNGLRAQSIINFSNSWDMALLSQDWFNPLDEVGLSILAEHIEKDKRHFDTFLNIARRATEQGNMIMAADIVAALCLTKNDHIDFKEIYISCARISFLSFEGKRIERLRIDGSFIERLDLTNSKLSDTVIICDSEIKKVNGVASRSNIPPQIKNNEIKEFELLGTTALIKKANLSDSQKIFVEMARKIFFQPGRGRKENALLRGMGVSGDKQLSQKILGMMIDDKLISKVKGDEGFIYIPERSQSSRIDRMLKELTLSSDPLWIKISSLD